MVDECVKVTELTVPDHGLAVINQSIVGSSEQLHILKKEEVAMTEECPVVKNTSNPPSENWIVGDVCIARWSDDGVWYNALVDSDSNLPGQYEVTFTDYGNSATVTAESIVATAAQIPNSQLDMIDECVHRAEQAEDSTTSLPSSREEETVSASSSGLSGSVSTTVQSSWKVGDTCVARWSEDCVWYNAEILKVSLEGFCVKFSDYGNEDTVKEEYIVLTGNDVPHGSDVDECVIVDHADYVPPAESTQDSSAPTKIPPPEEETSGFSPDNSVVQPRSVCEVPPSLQCSLCSNVCRRGMRLACGPAVACWGCAVKEVTNNRKCWMCGEEDISTDSHLVKDPVLRAFVDHFVSTGRLDPVHLQALKNGTLQPVNQEELKPMPTNIPSEDSLKSTLPIIKLEEKICSPLKNLKSGDGCIARWSEDNVWYNAVIEEITADGYAHVHFSDYGNSDKLKSAFLVKSPENLPPDAEVDPHVQTASSKSKAGKVESSGNLCPREVGLEKPPMDLLSLATPKQDLVITDLKGPVGLGLMVDQSLVVVCRGDGTVRRFSREGEFLGLVTSHREFVRPVDVLVLRCGDFVVRDELGIQLFGEKGKFIKYLGEHFINRCYGLAEDEFGRVITINCNVGSGGAGDLTDLGQTDIFYVDTSSGAVVKRVEMIDIVGEAKDKSACRFLTYHKEKLYVVDMGLDCVYVLFLKDGEEQAEVFGSTGNKAGQFRDPAGLVVDNTGTMMVVDSKNHRLQLFDSKYAFCGIVKVDQPLARPSGIFLDIQSRDLFVSNYSDQSVVSYKI
eukprot:GFUD01024641.1.p1 GENE.GFUD01024641.1~~GFUD01024641.1.p1  ORF type:complete len:831 (-),score=247.59 GFUD01024641.1:158-2524(-)